MAISITKPTVGGSEDTWGTTINTALDTIVDAANGTSGTLAPDLSTLTINGTDVTATAAELNIMDGVTATTAELNILDGVTSTAAELNILDGVTATTAELNIMDGVTATTAEINKLDGFTGVAADLNYAKDLRATGVTTTELDVLDGITASTAELNIMDGVTATTAELNIMDGVTATTAELNYVDGVTSNIQTQLNTITANDWVTNARIATDAVNADSIAASAVGASELNVSGNGTTSQFLRSDGDGTFTWATPTDTTYSAGTGMELSGTTFNSLGLGIGQSWAAQTRTSDTWYVNNTGKPIQAMYRVNTTSPNYFEYKTSSSGTVLQMQETNAASGTRETQTLIVPDGHYYRYRGIYDMVRELR